MHEPDSDGRHRAAGACRSCCSSIGDHAERFTRRNRTLHAQAAWYAPAGPQRWVLRTWTLYAVCLRLVRAYATERGERRRCHVQIMRSLASHRRWLRLALEPIEALEPRAFWIERWLFGAAATLKGAIRRSLGARMRGEAHPRAPGPSVPSFPSGQIGR